MAENRFLGALAFGGMMIGARILWTAAGNYFDYGGPLLVTHDAAEIRLANDSDESFTQCDVTIDGGYKARLAKIDGRSRTVVFRAEFDKNMPGDEFDRRAATLKVTCHDPEDNVVTMKLK